MQGKDKNKKLVIGLSLLCTFVMMIGCARLSSTPIITTSCTYEDAWSISLASVDEFELRRIDQQQGLIETEWISLTSNNKGGAFQRDSNQERARFFLNITQEPDTTHIKVQQTREFFSPMGVQSQSTHWRRVPPVEEEEQRLAARIQKRLKVKGC